MNSTLIRLSAVCGLATSCSDRLRQLYWTSKWKMQSDTLLMSRIPRRWRLTPRQLQRRQPAPSRTPFSSEILLPLREAGQRLVDVTAIHHGF